MTFPESLKDLQSLCMKNGIKYKGKTKAQLKDALAGSNVDDGAISENFAKYTVTILKDLCKEKGLSAYGNKGELVKRLESLEKNDNNGIRIVQWQKRGRKPTRPSETVGCEEEDDDDSEDDGTNLKFKDMKKQELKDECVRRNLPASGPMKTLVKRLKESDKLKALAAKNVNHEILCERCEENPEKLYDTPHAKWFCQDCSQHICTICKEAHEKLEINRTHVILPFGTILEFNVDNDLTVPVEQSHVTLVQDDEQFLDLSVPCLSPRAGEKRKLPDDSEDEDENSFEVVYETPMAKISYKNNKRFCLEIVPETPEVSITPPPAWNPQTPKRRTISIFSNISSLTFVPESPEFETVSCLQENSNSLNTSRDMFVAESPEKETVTCVQIHSNTLDAFKRHV